MLKCRLPGPTPEALNQNIWEGGGMCIFNYLQFEKNWGSEDLTPNHSIVGYDVILGKLLNLCLSSLGGEAGTIIPT